MHSSWLREKSVLLTAEHVAAEDKFTDWVCIGPVRWPTHSLPNWCLSFPFPLPTHTPTVGLVCMQVNKTINMLCSWHAQGKDSKEFQRHVDRVPDYLWLAEDGMKMQVPLSFSP